MRQFERREYFVDQLTGCLKNFAWSGSWTPRRRKSDSWLYVSPVGPADRVWSHALKPTS